MDPTTTFEFIPFSFWSDAPLTSHEFIPVYCLGYAAPPLKGGTTHGQCTMH